MTGLLEVINVSFSFGADYLRMRILVAEDDCTISEYVALGLREQGYAVDVVDAGDDALLAMQTVDYDVAILDVNLPRCSGFEVCERIRERAEGPPILFLTARDAIADKVHGLDLGGQDYLVKPFAFDELVARVRSLLRRNPSEPPILKVGELELDPAGRKVKRGGSDIALTSKEFALLEYLMRNAGRVMTKKMIAEHVWDFNLGGESNFIEALIYNVRKKVDSPFGSAMVHTVRGVGYRCEALDYDA
jgi:DNA-binding response OmpR family regulator